MKKEENNDNIIKELENLTIKENDSNSKEQKILKELENMINYKYNEKGELVHKITLEKCFYLPPDEYELVGMYVQKYVENYLITKLNLEVLFVPNNKSNLDFYKRDSSQAQCKILTTIDFPINRKCLVIIQGSGIVRLGQWSRNICINDNLELGTMIPYIEKAIYNELSVIILNPNERYDFENENKKINEFNTMKNHCLYVYNNIIKKNKYIKEIYFVAHSKGGECLIEILLNNKEDLLSGKIKRIAFTDSSHDNIYKKLGNENLKIFQRISRNYVCSTKPVGTFLGSYEKAKKGVSYYSSGHNIHEYTSGTAVSEIFKFFNSKEKDKKSKSIHKYK